jgi:hypothetical protein
MRPTPIFCSSAEGCSRVVRLMPVKGCDCEQLFHTVYQETHHFCIGNVDALFRLPLSRVVECHSGTSRCNVSQIQMLPLLYKEHTGVLNEGPRP